MNDVRGDYPIESVTQSTIKCHNSWNGKSHKSKRESSLKVHLLDIIVIAEPGQEVANEVQTQDKMSMFYNVRDAIKVCCSARDIYHVFCRLYTPFKRPQIVTIFLTAPFSPDDATSHLSQISMHTF